MNDYIEWVNSEEYREMCEAEDKFFAEHWANDMLDAPHALIAVIETKIARAALGERDRTYRAIYKYFRGYDRFPNNPHKIGEAELMFLLEKSVEGQDD